MFLLQVFVKVCSAHRLTGADDALFEFSPRQDLRPGPDYGIDHLRAFPDHGTGSYDGALDPRAGHDCAFMHGPGGSQLSVCRQVGIPLAEIEPFPLIEHDCAQFPFLGQFKKSGDDRDFFVLWQHFEEHRVDAVNTAEHMRSLRLAQHCPDIGYPIFDVVQRDVPGLTKGPHRQGHRQAGCLMRQDQLVQRQGGKDIAIVDEQGFVTHPALDVFQSTAGLQQHGLVEQREIPACAETLPRLRQMMRVDREPVDPGALTRFHGPCRQRPVVQRHQGLRKVVGERSEPGSQPGTQDKSLRHAA